MRFTRSEIAAAVSGTLHGLDGFVVDATIDSRSVPLGSLFVAILGERDGHDFVAAAIEAGAGAALVSRPMPEIDGSIVVTDTIEALQSLGRYARKRIPGSVIGITGSSGKTSTKDLLATIMRIGFVTAASEKSFNNELGVPLTLANAPDGAQHAIVEMGARGVGHIAELCRIAEPSIGIITNIGTAHRELFKTSEDTALAKSELVQSLPTDGTAVLNFDDEFYPLLRARTNSAVLTFSSLGSDGADFRATDVTLDDRLRASFRLGSPWGSAEVALATPGRHQVDNALAAAAAALTAGSTLEHVVAGCASASLSPWRMEYSRLSTGAVLINDAYNANPSSMRAAVDALAAVTATRRIAVLGTMAELGEEAEQFHREITTYATERGVSIIAVGEPRYGVPVIATNDAVLDHLLADGGLGSGDAVLVKGSRVARLELLAQRLQEHFGVAP